MAKRTKEEMEKMRQASKERRAEAKEAKKRTNRQKQILGNGENPLLYHKGIKMTKRELHERMKIEYIRGFTVDEIAARYDYNPQTIHALRSKNKWVAAKKTFENDKKLVTNDGITQLYAGFKVSVNIKYHEAWEKLMSIITMALDNPDKYLLYEDGGIRWGAIDTLAGIIERAQRGQERANGMLPEEVRYKLQIEREKLTLLRDQLGEGEGDEVLLDNFKEALDNAAKVVWADFGETTNKVHPSPAERKQGNKA